MINPVFFGCLLAFAGLVIAMGLHYYKKRQTKEEFWLAGRKLTLTDEILTTTATFNGSLNFLGLVGICYVVGISGIWYGAFLALGIALWGLLAAKRVRKKNIYSVNEIFDNPYSTHVRKTISFFYLLRNAMLLIVELIGGGLLLMVLANIPYSLGVVAVAGLIMIYTVLGGLWPVVRSDYVQLALMMFAYVTLSTAAIRIVDFTTLPAVMLTLGNVEPLALAGLVLTCMPLAWTVSPLYDRACAARDAKTATVGITVGGVLLLPLLIPSILLGIAARSAAINTSNPETAGVALALEYLPPYLTAILAVCILAAIISTSDSFLMSSGAIIGNEFSSSKNPTSAGQAIAATRIGMFTIGTLSMCIALFSTSVLSTFLLFMKVVVSALFIPTIIPLHMPGKSSPRAILAASWSGLVMAVIWTLCDTPLQLDPVIPGVFVSGIGYALVNRYGPSEKLTP